MLERRKYCASGKVLKHWKREMYPKDLKKVAEIRRRDIMFKRGEGQKNEKVYICRMKMKVMLIFLSEVSDIGSEKMSQKRLCALNGVML